MNQEKIMKARMITAICVALASLFALFIFAGLYFDQIKKNRLELMGIYEENMLMAAEEIEKYDEKQTDYDLHYNMVLSDLGAARSVIFLIDDYTDNQKTVNEIHYCFVKYPVQMRERLTESGKAFRKIAGHIDEGYEELREIIDSIDRLGS